MVDNEEFLQAIEKIKDSVDTLLKGFFDFKKELCKKKVDLSKQFSLINFPSKGLYYPNKKKSLLIKYLTANEEYVLCDSMLMESGLGIELVLDNLIMEDFNIKDLLLVDFQAILMFLRSTAFSDKVDITPKCPHCGKEDKNEFRLSQMKFKEPKDQPNEFGKYVIFLPEIEMEVIISPLTLGKELEKIKNESDEDYFIIKDDEGIDTKIKKEKSLSLVYNIDSINGITDKEQIKKIIRKLPKKHSDTVFNFIKRNEMSVRMSVSLVLPRQFSPLTRLWLQYFSQLLPLISVL